MYLATAILVSLILGACTPKMNNEYQKSKLDCGEDAEGWGQDYVKVFQNDNSESSGSYIEAINGDQQLKVSKKACVKIDRNLKGSIVVRDTRPNSKQSTIFALQNISLPGKITLVPTPELKPQFPCNGGTILSNTGLLQLELATEELTEKLNRFVLSFPDFDQQFSIEKNELGHSSDISSLKDGRYQVNVIAKGVLQNAEKVVSQCDVILDRKKPSFKFQPQYKVSAESEYISISAGSSWTSEIDEAKGKIYVSKKMISEDSNKLECSQEFFPASAFQTPQSGRWLICSYATDQAGNSSSTQTHKIKIHENEKEKLFHSYSQNAKLFAQNKNKVEAIRYSLKAFGEYISLALEEDRQRLSLPLRASFLETLSASYHAGSKRFKETMSDVTQGDSSIIATGFENAYVYSKDLQVKKLIPGINQDEYIDRVIEGRNGSFLLDTKPSVHYVPSNGKIVSSDLDFYVSAMTVDSSERAFMGSRDGKIFIFDSNGLKKNSIDIGDDEIKGFITLSKNSFVAYKKQSIDLIDTQLEKVVASYKLPKEFGEILSLKKAKDRLVVLSDYGLLQLTLDKLRLSGDILELHSNVHESAISNDRVVYWSGESHLVVIEDRKVQGIIDLESFFIKSIMMDLRHGIRFLTIYNDKIILSHSENRLVSIDVETGKVTQLGSVSKTPILNIWVHGDVLYVASPQEITLFTLKNDAFHKEKLEFGKDDTYLNQFDSNDSAVYYSFSDGTLVEKSAKTNAKMIAKSSSDWSIQRKYDLNSNAIVTYTKNKLSVKGEGTRVESKNLTRISPTDKILLASDSKNIVWATESGLALWDWSTPENPPIQYPLDFQVHTKTILESGVVVASNTFDKRLYFIDLINPNSSFSIEIPESITYLSSNGNDIILFTEFGRMIKLDGNGLIKKNVDVGLLNYIVADVSTSGYIAEFSNGALRIKSSSLDELGKIFVDDMDLTHLSAGSRKLYGTDGLELIEIDLSMDTLLQKICARAKAFGIDNKACNRAN